MEALEVRGAASTVTNSISPRVRLWFFFAYESFRRMD